MSMQLPDFSVITFLPLGQRIIPPGGEKRDLNKFFTALINRQKLELDQYHLAEMLGRDLTIDIDKLDHRLVSILAEALVYYVRIWPGWGRSSEYHSGQLQSKEWFERFRQYLIFKSNFLIKNAQKFSHEGRSTRDQQTQTDTPANSQSAKRLAPYTLCVGGPPSVLNSVVFMEYRGNIQIKQHTEKPWELLEVKQLLNWPHVSVEVKLPDISLSRTNTHMFHRNLALCGDYTVLPEVSHITHITKVHSNTSNPDSELKPYTYNYIAAYIKQFNEVTKKIPDLNPKRLQELDTIFSEFLADMKEVNVYNCTMCPNISIGYHIGGCRYIRNKKMVNANVDKRNQDKTAVNFYEILIPQMDFTLYSFKAVQDFADKTNVSFQSLNRIINKLLPESTKTPNVDHPEMSNLKFLINNTCVVYNCVLCKTNLSGPHALVAIGKHFADHHKTEQAVLCYRCRKQFQVQFLTRNRWKHNCI